MGGGSTSIEFSGICFDYNRAPGNESHAYGMLRIEEFDRVRLSCIRVRCSDNMGIVISTCRDVLIENCDIGGGTANVVHGYSIDGSGIWIVRPQVNGATIVDKNRVTDTYDDGILVGHDIDASDGRAVIANNVVTNCGANAITSTVPNSIIWVCTLLP